MERKYKFNWDLIGNLQVGRPNLGSHTRVEVYRLMQFAFRDVLERRFGSKAADEIFFEGGKLAGHEFYGEFLADKKSFSEFVGEFQRIMKEMGIGIVRIEQGDSEARKLLLTVEEDLDCSGLPELDYEICTYDEGFIAGVMECHTGNTYDVKEIDCWCTGDRTCRFEAVRSDIDNPE